MKRILAYLLDENKIEEDAKKKAYLLIIKFICIGLFCASILNIVASQYLYDTNWIATISLSSFQLILAAAGFFAIKKIKSIEVLEIIVFCITSLTTIITILAFKQYASVTVWVITFLIIQMALVSMNRVLILFTTVISLIMVIEIWVTTPPLWVRIDTSDHIGRIGFILFAACMALVINKIFVKSITQSVEHVDELLKKNIENKKLIEVLTISEEELIQQNDTLEQLNKRVIESENIYRLLAEATSDGIWYYNYETKENLHSDRFYEIVGSKDYNLGIHNWQSFIHPDDLPYLEQVFNEHLSGKSDMYESVYRLRITDGSYKWVKERGKAIFDEKNRLKLVVGTYTDINDLVSNQDRLMFLDNYDQLSGLVNRKAFIHSIENKIKIERYNKTGFYLMLLNIDDFKSVNELYGHGVGDNLIKYISKSILRLIPEDCIFCRMAGDEFGLLLNETFSEEKLMEFIDTLQKNCGIVNNLEITYTLGIGIAKYPENGNTSSELLRSVDVALRRAKSKGRCSVQFFEEKLKDEILDRIELEKYLEQAIIRNEMSIHLQPLFNTEKENLIGFEALARWMHPTKGSISPTMFIPLAERSNTIIEIGDFVLENSCKMIKMINTKYNTNYFVAVNVSAVQLRKADF